ncbi:hypothetical protein HDU67_008074 [Dinochytrium kinnereticum]|nr:hypothetical protein HDU67_008074 [Dinochytrium kinnereticum]
MRVQARRRAPNRSTKPSEKDDYAVTVTEFIVVFEGSAPTTAPDIPSHLVSYNAMGYGFNPNEIVLVERQLPGTTAVSRATSSSSFRNVASATSTRRNHATITSRLRGATIPPSAFATQRVFPASPAQQTSYSSINTTTILPILFSSALIIFGIGICVFFVAKSRLSAAPASRSFINNDDPNSKKTAVAQPSASSIKTTQVASSAVSTAPPTFVREDRRDLKPKGAKISIVTDAKMLDPNASSNSGKMCTTPGGSKVPKRSTSIGNPMSPRRLTLTAVQAALGESQKVKPKSSKSLLGMITGKKSPVPEITSISSPTQVYQGNQLIVNEKGRMVSSSNAADDDPCEGRDSTTSTSSTSSSISTVSSGAPETEFRYDVIVPWIPQRFDELALAPGDSVLVYKVYEDGWCDGKHEASGEEGVFPLACLRGRTWSFFGMVDGNEEDEEEGGDDSRTVRNMEREAKEREEPVELSSDELAEPYAQRPNKPTNPEPPRMVNDRAGSLPPDTEQPPPLPPKSL